MATMKIITKQDRRNRIRKRLRTRIHGLADRPRLAVFRSVQHVYVQAIDDSAGRTIASASSVEPAVRAAMAAGARGGNVAGAKTVGRVIAERLIAAGIRRAVFDRGGYLYHGRVRAIAEAAREAGLEF
jgi:large subunit ribosomal protein L18